MSVRSTSVLSPKPSSARSSLPHPQSPSSPTATTLDLNNLTKYIKHTQIFLPSRKLISDVILVNSPSQIHTLLQQITKLCNNRFSFCGVLNKTGGKVKTIKTRFCILKDKQLHYFVVPKNIKEGNALEEDVCAIPIKEAKGSILLDSDTSFSIGKSRNSSFFIHAKDRDYEFIASSDDEVQTWINECKREALGKPTQFYSSLIINGASSVRQVSSRHSVFNHSNEEEVFSEEDTSESSPISITPTLSPNSSSIKMKTEPKRSMTQMLSPPSPAYITEVLSPRSKSIRRSLYTGEVSALEENVLGNVPTASALLASMNFGTSVQMFQSALQAATADPRLSIADIDMYNSFEEYSDKTTTDAPLKKQQREPYLSEEDELEIALSAAEIFLKHDSERTVEEKAYVIAMKQYYQGLQWYLNKLKRKRSAQEAQILQVEYSLASGSCLFVQFEQLMQENQEGTVEREFIDMILEMYKQHLLARDSKTTSTSTEKISLQKEWLDALQHTWKSYLEGKAEDEYWKSLAECKIAISKFEHETGLKMKVDSVPSLGIVMARYPQELSFEEVKSLHQLNELYFV